MAERSDLHLPDGAREVVLKHLADLEAGFRKRGWGARSGFGNKPALIVIDLAKMWTNPDHPVGADLDTTVRESRRLLDAARQANIPIFFTTMSRDPNDPVRAGSKSDRPRSGDELRPGAEGTQLDPRLGRLPTEKLIVKKYTSSFKGTDLHEMLTVLGVDTLIITGCTTSGCIYAACRDAVASFRVIVPREAVGDRCEVLGLTFLLDIDMKIGDVMPVDDVIAHLAKSPVAPIQAPVAAAKAAR